VQLSACGGPKGCAVPVIGIDSRTRDSGACGAASSWNFLNKRFARTFERAIAARLRRQPPQRHPLSGGRAVVDGERRRQGDPQFLSMPKIGRDYGLVGRFDKSSPRVMVICNAPQLLGPKRLRIWRGYGTSANSHDWSDPDMG